MILIISYPSINTKYPGIFLVFTHKCIYMPLDHIIFIQINNFFFFLLSDAINFISPGSNIFNFKTSEKCLKIHFNYLKDQFNTIQSNSFIKQKGNAK